MNKNKGITLIALVITIIVLLILAGVAISMLSGENGILRKAAEAKTKTEQAQKEEEAILTDYEIDGYFIEKGYQYKCRYGFITGIAVEERKVTDTVKDLNDALPSGYTISGDGITDSTKLYTGMEIKKDGNVVARVVVFGDVDCDGEIAPVDGTKALRIVEGLDEPEDYQKVAIDVDHNSVLNSSSNAIDDRMEYLEDLLSKTENEMEKEKIQKQIEELNKKKESTSYDVEEIIKYINNWYGDERDIPQNAYATNPNKITYTTKVQVREDYVKSIPQEFYNAGYKWEQYNESTYIIKGITRGTTTVGDIKSVLPENTIIKCGDDILSNSEVINEEATGARYRVYINSDDYGFVLIARFE